MDQLLQMIQSADPTDNQSDSVELLQLEGKAIPACKRYFVVPLTFLSFFDQLTPSLVPASVTSSSCVSDPARCVQSDGTPH